MLWNLDFPQETCMQIHVRSLSAEDITAQSRALPVDDSFGNNQADFPVPGDNYEDWGAADMELERELERVDHEAFADWTTPDFNEFSPT